MNTSFTTMYEWHSLPWRKLERQAYKLQTRIYRASRRGDVKTVHRWQRLLLKSWAVRCLAVRRVSQDNQGKTNRWGRWRKVTEPSTSDSSGQKIETDR